MDMPAVVRGLRPERVSGTSRVSHYLFSVTIAFMCSSVANPEAAEKSNSLKDLKRDIALTWLMAIERDDHTFHTSKPDEVLGWDDFDERQDLYLCIPSYDDRRYQAVYVTYYRTEPILKDDPGAALSSAANYQGSTEFSAEKDFLYLYSNGGMRWTIADWTSSPDEKYVKDGFVPEKIREITDSDDLHFRREFIGWHQKSTSAWPVESVLNVRANRTFINRLFNVPTLGKKVRIWHANQPWKLNFRPIQPDLSRTLVRSVVRAEDSLFSHHFLIWIGPNRPKPSWIRFNVLPPKPGGLLVLKCKFKGYEDYDVRTYYLFNGA